MNMDTTIIFIVNGEDVPVAVNPQEQVRAARNKALEESKNTGRPPDDWEIRDAQGNLVDPSAKIASFNFPAGVRLTLTLKVGAGG